MRFIPLEPETDQEEYSLDIIRNMPSPLTPEDICRMKEAEERVNAVLKTLSPRAEKIVRLCIMQSVSIEEVASELAINPVLARTILRSSLNKLSKPERANLLREARI